MNSMCHTPEQKGDCWEEGGRWRKQRTQFEENTPARHDGLNFIDAAL